MSNLVMWTIYDHPKDYPQSIVARKWEVYQGASFPTPFVAIFPELHMARTYFAACGLACLTRQPDDDPTIIETWM